MHYTELSELGVGLAADVANIMPQFRDFIGSPDDTIDYLNVGAHFSQQQRIEYYIDDLIKAGFPIIFHPVNFNIAIEKDTDSKYMEAISDIALYMNANWMGQDMAVWMYEDQYLGAFLVPTIIDEESAVEVASKAAYLNKNLPCPFLIENPPICFSLETMHLLDFMGLVSKKADCGIVLDIGHLIGYQQATGRSLRDMPLSRFPFENVVEIHLAGLEFSHSGDQVAIIDQHAQPVHNLCWDFLEEHIHRMNNLKGITLEQEFCQNELVLTHLRRARQITKERGLFKDATGISNSTKANVG